MKKAGWMAALAICTVLAGALTGCAGDDGRRTVRIGHNQSTSHPTHLGLTAFADFINENLGDSFLVEVYPSELLGSQTEMVQLTQTGAIELVVASNSIMETFSPDYSLFNLPYLFSGQEAYHAAMDDPAVTDPIFLSTGEAGFVCVTWLDAGTRNFYTVDTPIESPADLKGMKIRVQQSPTNVAMMELLGGTATPMGFGDVYTALQSQIIDGAENNELALTSNGHGDVCKFYSYDMHQMIPDLVLANVGFLESLTAEERAVFDEGFRLINTVQRTEWTGAVEEAKRQAEEKQNVTFLYPDTEPFRQAVLPLHEQLLAANEDLRPIYDRIMAHNEEVDR